MATEQNVIASGTAAVNGVTVTLPTWAAGRTGTIVVWTACDSNARTCANPTGGGTYVARGNVIGNSSMRIYAWTKDIADSDSGTTLTMTWTGNGAVISGYYIVDNEFYSSVNTYTGGSGTTVYVSASTVTALTSPNRAIGIWGGRGAANGSAVTLTAVTATPNNSKTVTTPRISTARNIGMIHADYSTSSVTIPRYRATSSQTTSYGGFEIILAPPVASVTDYWGAAA